MKMYQWKLGQILDQRSLTISDLSFLARVQPATIRGMVKNTSKMVSLKVLYRICEALGITPNDLFWVDPIDPMETTKPDILIHDDVMDKILHG